MLKNRDDKLIFLIALIWILIELFKGYPVQNINAALILVAGFFFFCFLRIFIKNRLWL